MAPASTNLAQSLVALADSLVNSTDATTSGLVKDYSGPTFFNGWNFFGSYDSSTSGDETYLSAQDAMTSQLAFVDPATNHAFIKVDNTSTVPFNQKRNSLRLSITATYPVGSVWLADIFHAPYGCFRLGGLLIPQRLGHKEGVNQVTPNQMGLHTLPGCMQSSLNQLAFIVNSTDCAGTNNVGCVVTDPQPATYGQQFAATGGGVFITEFAEAGISVWFIPRSNVPSSITSNSSSIDTSQLGEPTDNWPAAGCNINQFFRPQSLVFAIPLCGSFAGNPTIFNQTCQGVCYSDFVFGDGSNHATAYFEVGSIRAVSQNVTGASTSSGGENTQTSRNGQTSGNTTQGNSALSSVDPRRDNTLTPAALSIMLAFWMIH